MPPKFTVETLPDEQFEFVINAIINGDTNREISASFKTAFNTELAKSSLARWREVTGDELAERYKLARFQAKQLLEDLDQKDADKFSVVMSNIEDRLLVATKEVISQDPIKLLGIQQEERRRQLRVRELDLKERAQTFNEEQAKKAEQLQHDRFAIAAETWRFVLAYIRAKAPVAIDALTDVSPELLKELETFIENQSS
jgi:hypothetical protein